MSHLVIVESPAKAKTIEKYLGKDYSVVASVGHIRDLPKSKLGVDVDNNFEPKYENKKDKAALIKELKKDAKASDIVYLATDPDREGEAISWHLAHVLGISPDAPVRVTFSEITKSGIAAGMSHPRTLDMDLINAQQARRILDRIVGYKLSPFLWKKVRRGLSAGRVQSVAVRLIVDREQEIESFEAQEYWSIDAKLLSASSRRAFPAKLTEVKGEKFKALNKEETDKVLAMLENGEFIITNIKNSTRKKTPAPPFTTSTLQQEASRKLSFNARRTMKAAQELYEGVEIPDMGAVGIITYMRTDSLRISDEAKAAAAQMIESTYGKEYLPSKPRVFKSKNNAQDAHEAIRPTIITLTPEKVKSALSGDQYKLYKLIWERFMASQMENQLLDTKAVDITCGECLFKANGYTVKFDGFTKLYEESKDNVIGILNLKDLFFYRETHRNEVFDIYKVLREPFFTYEYQKTSTLMEEMRNNSISFAIVLDEYGSTAGLVTLEDLIEEIVGDIKDEFDDAETDAIRCIGTDEYEIEGSTKLDDLNDVLGTEIESDDYDSIGGHMIELLDHLPKEGETVKEGNYLYSIKKMDKNRVEIVYLKIERHTSENEETSSEV